MNTSLFVRRKDKYLYLTDILFIESICHMEFIRIITMSFYEKQTFQEKQNTKKSRFYNFWWISLHFWGIPAAPEPTSFSPEPTSQQDMKTKITNCAHIWWNFPPNHHERRPIQKSYTLNEPEGRTSCLYNTTWLDRFSNQLSCTLHVNTNANIY